jgi:hypothetical protein
MKFRVANCLTGLAFRACQLNPNPMRKVSGPYGETGVREIGARAALVRTAFPPNGTSGAVGQ